MQVVEGYYDFDGDGFGQRPRSAVAGAANFTRVGGDCNDADPNRHPDASESCDGIDSDCDGLTDLEDPDVPTSDVVSWYEDFDGDGYASEIGHLGSVNELQTTCISDRSSTFATVLGDCEPFDPTSHPGAVDIEGDYIDQDCDGVGGGRETTALCDGSKVFDWVPDYAYVPVFEGVDDGLILDIGVIADLIGCAQDLVVFEGDTEVGPWIEVYATTVEGWSLDEHWSGSPHLDVVAGRWYAIAVRVGDCTVAQPVCGSAVDLNMTPLQYRGAIELFGSDTNLPLALPSMPHDSVTKKGLIWASVTFPAP